MKIYLASKSPRRQQLLSLMGVEFEVLKIDIPEMQKEGESPEEYSKRITKEKLNAAWDFLEQEKLPYLPILCADTEVVIENKIIGKPKDYQDAFNTLKSYSEKSHWVLTSVGVKYCNYQNIQLNKTQVYFDRLTDEDIHAYLKVDNYKDKAGAYGIQSYIAQFIPRINGCYYAVMGLPLNLVRQLLNEVKKEL
ncbi:septum formation protein (plasmid) [Legionella adelaidensis]|uniref:dTTP/UTP pyrophosphatase n=1 Tax=Legionella adelaidensis TaxID=45056 RepID=A0A0W0R1H2_9GAMM|nr:Maf family protein [Legionella adelaidensis]KTC64919.1 septum formation protein [Legionella adelaidensis]VEH85602.1 septum formation protein [Legionella adelaidensis]